MDFNKLEARYREVEQELVFARRKREEEAKVAAKLLSEISDEMAQKLSAYIPAILTIRGYSEEDLIKNNNREIETLQETYGEASRLLEQWLTQLEESLK